MFSDRDNVISGLPNGKGTILIGTRVVQGGREIPGAGDSFIPYTLFHELLHAGSISAGLPFKDGDDRFEKFAKQIGAMFTGSVTTNKGKPQVIECIRNRVSAAVLCTRKCLL